jgi:hypothetical protein
MSSSILPVEATQDAVDDVQSVTSKDDLSPPATLVTEPQPPVLITEQEVMLGTAAAVAPKTTPIIRRMIDALRVVGAALRPPPPGPHYARQEAYIEDARMAREMDRL